MINMEDLKQDYDKSIHSNPSALAWAEFFKQNFPDVDLDLMLGWFANAMMAMHDHIYQEKIPEIKLQWLREIAPEIEVLFIDEDDPNDFDDGYNVGKKDYRKELFANAEKSIEKQSIEKSIGENNKL